MSFDLVVWAPAVGASPARVRAAYARCRHNGPVRCHQEQAGGEPSPELRAFYADLTARYPDLGGGPWASTPLHRAADHVEMRMADDCPDEVLLTIERLAMQHGLALFDPQGDALYPPPVRARS